MVKESKFYFIPLKQQKRIEKQLYVKITSSGNMWIPQNTLNTIGSDSKSFFMHLYCDQNARALAFKISYTYNGETGRKNSVRVVTPIKAKSGSTIFATVGVRSFMSSLDNIHLPTPRLTLRKYKDGYLNDELWYIVIPRGKPKQKQDD